MPIACVLLYHLPHFTTFCLQITWIPLAGDFCRQPSFNVTLNFYSTLLLPAAASVFIPPIQTLQGKGCFESDNHTQFREQDA